MNRSVRRALVPALAAAVALTLAACGATAGTASGSPGQSSTGAGTSTPPTGSAPSGPHDQSDVEFATQMIPHHGQAISMADLAATKATDPAVKSLAAEIKAAQGPEITTMSGWLQGWGQPVPAVTGGPGAPQTEGMSTGSPGMGASGSNGPGMAGMMSDDDMRQLSQATGTGFDRRWLQLMVRHHQGAVAMSQSELSSGSNSAAKHLAQAIIDGQTKEISTMSALLASLGGG